MAELHLYQPEYPFPDQDRDTAVDRMLRNIGAALDPDGTEWGSKYLGTYRNDVFAAHVYCWCEEEIHCPWCRRCQCPSDSHKVFIDGRTVSAEEDAAFFQEKYGLVQNAHTEHEREVREAELQQRRQVVHIPSCDFCLSNDVCAEKGGLPGKSAPNFWHFESGLKIWFYKCIGRNVEVNKNLSRTVIRRVERQCLESLSCDPESPLNRRFLFEIPTPPENAPLSTLSQGCVCSGENGKGEKF